MIKVPASEGSQEREMSYHVQKAEYGAQYPCQRISASFSRSSRPWVPEDGCQALFALRLLWSAPRRSLGMPENQEQVPSSDAGSRAGAANVSLQATSSLQADFVGHVFWDTGVLGSFPGICLQPLLCLKQS